MSTTSTLVAPDAFAAAGERIGENRRVFLVIALVLAFVVVPEPWRLPVIGIGAAIEVLETAAEVWWSRRGRIKVGPETVIGAVGWVIRDCRPDGQVRVQGEIWLARCEAGADAGQRVTVIGRDGLTLVVEPVQPSPGVST